MTDQVSQPNGNVSRVSATSKTRHRGSQTFKSTERALDKVGVIMSRTFPNSNLTILSYKTFYKLTNHPLRRASTDDKVTMTLETKNTQFRSTAPRRFRKKSGQKRPLPIDISPVSINVAQLRRDPYTEKCTLLLLIHPRLQ